MALELLKRTILADRLGRKRMFVEQAFATFKETARS
jgi:hypothetical protein